MKYKYLLIPFLWFSLVLIITGCSTLEVFNISDVRTFLMNDRELEKEVADVNLELINKEYNLYSPEANSNYNKITNTLEKRNNTALDYNIYLSDSEAVNALYIGDGNIILFAGLLEMLEYREDQIAAVIAHEMGHGTNNHIVENVRTNAKARVLGKTLGKAGVNEAVRNYGIYFLKNGFSREQEEEADISSLKLLKKAEYDPEAALRVMQKLDEMNAADLKALEIFQTHPLPQTRIEYMSAYLQTH